jgi:hypothetical protein
MRNKLLAFIAAGAVASISPLLAQTSGGSTYSIFNIGDLPVGTSAASAGHAGIESAMPSANTLNSVNPAGWADMSLVTLQAGFLFEQYKVSTASLSSYQNNSKLHHFSVAIPYSDTYGGTIGFSIRPLSQVAYRTQVERQVPTSDSSTTTALVTTLGRGGISEVMIGSSFQPIKEVTIGAAVSPYFGSINSTTNVEFPNASLNQAIYSTSDRYSGLGARIGVRVEPIENLRIGGVFETGATLDRERTNSSYYLDQGKTISDTTGKSTESITLPPRITFGASYITGRFLLAGEATMQSWSTENFSTARNSMRVAIGADRLASTSVNAEGFERWTFRLGGFYDQTYYSLPGGDVNSIGATLGFGVPLTTFTGLNAGTYLDLGLEVGNRGTTTGGLTQEFYGKLYLDIAVSELWFVRTKR